MSLNIRFLRRDRLQHNVSDVFTGDEILYGTTDGKIGLLQIEESYATAKWEIDNDKKKGGILWIGLYRSVACFIQLECNSVKVKPAILYSLCEIKLRLMGKRCFHNHPSTFHDTVAIFCPHQESFVLTHTTSLETE